MAPKPGDEITLAGATSISRYADGPVGSTMLESPEASQMKGGDEMKQSILRIALGVGSLLAALMAGGAVWKIGSGPW